jgi:hypothetical protein
MDWMHFAYTSSCMGSAKSRPHELMHSGSENEGAQARKRLQTPAQSAVLGAFEGFAPGVGDGAPVGVVVLGGGGSSTLPPQAAHATHATEAKKSTA